MKTLRYCRAADTVGQILSCCESRFRLRLAQNDALFIPAEDRMPRPARRHLCLVGQRKALPEKLVNSAVPAQGRALKPRQGCGASRCLQPNPGARSLRSIPRCQLPRRDPWAGLSEGRDAAGEPGSTRLAGGKEKCGMVSSLRTQINFYMFF